MRRFANFPALFVLTMVHSFCTVPSGKELAERLDSVLRVIYLIYTEGYSASSGTSLTRSDISEEAIRLGRLLLEFLPETEVRSLLALMLLQESRRAARTSAEGEIVLLPEQDRSLWNREQIVEGKERLGEAISSHPVGAYTVQAAVHADASNANATDWTQIVHLTVAGAPIVLTTSVDLRHGHALQVTVSKTVVPDRARPCSLREARFLRITKVP
jgi:RNA polymerase sigma-70 factor, ECF subfamily